MIDDAGSPPLAAASDGALFRRGSGGLVDRSRTIAFSFDGTRYLGHPGDTLASALLANGVRLVGRSFKYHRPRGVLTAGPEEPNALVELRAGARREPNTRATTAELYDGLEAASQNRWPSLRFDLLSLNGALGSMLAAGFYYKTFMWPASFWEKVYEPLIRRAAGLGRAAGEADPDTYEKSHLHCDVLVIGSGPAGLMAALAAGRAGARVVLAEQDFRLGGRLLADARLVAGEPASPWAASVEAELRSLPDVRLLPRTTVVGTYDHGTYAAVEKVADHLPVPPPFEPRQRLWRIVARRAVLAAGSIERPLAFVDNDRPGVMLAGAVRTYINRFAVLPGSRAVVYATSDDAAETVAALARAGAEVAAVIDARGEASPVLASAAARAGSRLVTGGAVERVQGRRAVQAVDVRTGAMGSVRFDCDVVAVAGGWNPTIHLASHQGHRPLWSEALAAFIPGKLPPGLAVAGAAAGEPSLGGALMAGATAGLAAAGDCGFAGHAVDIPATDAETVRQSVPRVAVAGRGKAFIDLQHDVTTADIVLAHREGFAAAEHMKRYTTLGMATDQGKTSALSGLFVLSEIKGETIAETGTTTYRPPFDPVSFGVLGGHHRGKAFRPTRLTPTHAWALEQGAVLVEAGAWLRAQWYPNGGEADWLESVTREVRAVRTRVGVCDVSTLGKIDVQGPDAAAFLDLVYANTMSTLPVGRVRYGLMLREDGFVLDDGTVARLDDQRFVVTTTTANAAKVLQHLEHALEWLWPGLDAQLASVTDQWAQIALTGPRARLVLRGVVDPQHDLSDAAVPHLAARAVTVIGGVAARLFRISYSGELGYEIAVPAGHGDALMRRLMDAGSTLGITPYGTEALAVMRIEKGHVAGNEINGQTTARDLGLARLVSRNKDCIGRVMAGRPALVDPERPALVGLKPVDRNQRLRPGAHMIGEHAEAIAASDEGYVTSVAYSPTLGHWLGLGLLAGGKARHGQRVRAFDPVRHGDVAVEVCDPVFYDPAGERLHG
ncbi:MAG: sarcosine oxidase subunit alpha family protein [Hyphomicrobiaceae bacterium]|nr:sarcosine oxidase subunit alpha family protein [Hyphomicrobiaceae bacterium]